MDNVDDLIKGFSKILEEKNIDLNNVMNNNENKNIYQNTDLNIDIDTILKIKTIIEKIKKNQNNNRNKLLDALKPYLKEAQKERLDDYIKIANTICALNEFSSNSILDLNKKGYDYILIITLVLLII